MDSSEFETVDDEGAVKEVLRWLHQRYVWKVSGSDIIFHEELRYIVKKETIQQDPCWEARASAQSAVLSLAEEYLATGLPKATWCEKCWS